MCFPSFSLRCYASAFSLILVFFMETGISFAQTWQPMGPDQRNAQGLSSQTVFKLFNRNDSIYAAVRDQYNTTLLIKRFDGTSWVTMGTPFGTGLNAQYKGPGYAVITLDQGYTQYVAYPDPSQAMLGGYKPTVKKLVNGVWQTVGQPGIGQHAATVYGLEIDSFGTPYLLFNTNYDQKPNVMKFDGSAWVAVGPPSFSTSTAANPILKLDPQGIPYVAYHVGPTGNSVSVLTFVNNTWTQLTSIAGAASNYAFSMALKANGFPIIAVKTTSSVTVEDFDGTNWTTLPSPGNIPGSTSYLAVDAANMPYLLAGGNVRKFDGTSWNVLGTSPGQPINSGALEIVAGQPVVANEDKVKRFDGVYWPMAGEYGYSPGLIETSRIAISSSGAVFSAFKDYELGGKLTVKRYANGSWTFAGQPGFTTDVINNVAIAAGRNDTIFVVYTTWSGKKPKVIRYDGASWDEVGTGTNVVSTASLTDFSLATDTSGAPLLAFVDPAYFNACHVRKFEKGMWTSVGGGVMNTAPATGLTVRVAPDNTIYLLTHLYLAKFVGGTWQTVGNYGGSYGKTDLRIDRNGTPYIAYVRNVKYGNLVHYHSQDYVVKFDGVNWVDLGGGPYGINASHPDANIYFLNLAIDTTDRLYLASYIEDDYGVVQPWVVIKTFNGTEWGRINAAWHGWSGFNFPQSDFQLEAANDHLYFAYDDGNAYLLGIPLPLLFLNVPETPTSAEHISLYPNPATNSLTISSTGLDAKHVTIEIIDVIGRVAMRTTGLCINGVINQRLNTESLRPGSYLIVIKGEQERRVGKIIKE